MKFRTLLPGHFFEFALKNDCGKEIAFEARGSQMKMKPSPGILRLHHR
jgi:hypothetical protein